MTIAKVIWTRRIDHDYGDFIPREEEVEIEFQGSFSLEFIEAECERRFDYFNDYYGIESVEVDGVIIYER